MEQLTLDLGNRDIWCGRTSPAHSLRERQAEKTSESSSKKSVKSQTKKFLFLDLRGGDGATQEPSWETDFRLHGELWTLNIGEFPSVAVESHLSQILEGTPHPKYYLSAKGCDGVINRADRRGKTNFPEVLREALEEQSEYLKSHPNAINEATEWYESHPNAINDKVGTLCYETYRKTAHPRNDKEPQGYEKADKADTLNVFDNTEMRTPMLVKEAQWGGVLFPEIVGALTASDRFQPNGEIIAGRKCVIHKKFIALDRAAYNQGKNANYDIGVDESGTAFTVVAKGPGLVKE